MGGGWSRKRRSVGLLELLVGGLALVELGGQLLVGALPEGLLDELAGLAALAAGEAARLDLVWPLASTVISMIFMSHLRRGWSA